MDDTWGNCFVHKSYLPDGQYLGQFRSIVENRYQNYYISNKAVLSLCYYPKKEKAVLSLLN